MILLRLVDYAMICPPQKRYLSVQKISHLAVPFLYVRDALDTGPPQ
jgi:hypothetical protein